MLRLSTVVFLLLSISVAVAQDPCASEDATLDMCLERAGASDIIKDSCDACLEGIKASLAYSSACDEADAEACGAFALCECEGCVPEALAKGECEIDAERSSNGIACPAIMCDRSGGDSVATGANGEFSDEPIEFSADSTDSTQIPDVSTTAVTLKALDSAGSVPSKRGIIAVLGIMMMAVALA